MKTQTCPSPDTFNDHIVLREQRDEFWSSQGGFRTWSVCNPNSNTKTNISEEMQERWCDQNLGKMIRSDMNGGGGENQRCPCTVHSSS